VGHARTGVFLAACALLALVGGSASAGQGRVSAKPKYIVYGMTYTGLLLVQSKRSGLQENGGDCQLTADDLHSPYEDHASAKIAWDTVYRFRYTVGGAHGAGLHIIPSASMKLHGSSYRFGGYYYDGGCHKITYGAGGKDCTGTLRSRFRGTMLTNVKIKRKGADFVIHLQPFGELSANPVSCLNDDNPPGPVNASDELDLANYGAAVTAHAYSTHERFDSSVTKTIHYPIHGHKNCAAGDDPKVCTITTTGDGFLQIHPIPEH
jgi:hypothetical protein